MTDRPILFSAPMVRALLDGRKTQTRRVIKPQPDDLVEGQIPRQLRISIDDRLWVRESLSVSCNDQDVCWAAYTADGSDVWPLTTWTKPRNSVPSIHMPRWASRLTLTVTDVRVERLQDISEKDALEEGIETDVWDMAPVAKNYSGADAWFVGWPMGILAPSISVDAVEVCRRSYASLWEKINGPGSWDKNPWVSAYTFTVERGNIDSLPKAAA